MFGASIVGKIVGVMCFFVVIVLYYQLSFVLSWKPVRGCICRGSRLDEVRRDYTTPRR